MGDEYNVRLYAVASMKGETRKTHASPLAVNGGSFQKVAWIHIGRGWK